MYQAGEVDYLVATDAIGMGLNMDVDHVAFAGLSKFDGNRRRRLTPAEMAQIAGRAGRHQRDGTFGTLTLEGDALAEFRPEEIERIEEHRFAPLDFLYWRESELDFAQRRGADPLARAPAGPARAPRRARGGRSRRPQVARRRSARSSPAPRAPSWSAGSGPPAACPISARPAPSIMPGWSRASSPI